mgnify:CR=1 FL=1
MSLKEIHIGKLIEERVLEIQITNEKICNFLNCTDQELLEIYASANIKTEILLKISKLLQYDFFRIFSQHLILFAPISKLNKEENISTEKSKLPQFRKNIYTQEVIFFILELIEKKEKTIAQVITDYQIPKTTLYKWIHKYKI